MSVHPYLELFVAGLLTFASPCVLPMLPVYVSALGGAAGTARTQASEASETRRVRLAGVGFALGVSLVFVTLGMGAAAIAAPLAAYRRILLAVAGVVIAVLGARLLGLVRLSWLDRTTQPLLARMTERGGLLGGLFFGAAFSLGWTPCVGPVLGAALTYAAGTASSPWRAGAELIAYALGFSTPLVAATFAASRVLPWTRRFNAYTPVLQGGMGVLMIAVGALLASDRISVFALPAVSGSSATAGSPCEAPGSHACAAPEVAAGTAPIEAPTGQPRLLEFASTHCPACAKMKPLLRDVERACAPAAGTVVRVDVDDPRAQGLVVRYGVRLLPTFISVDTEGDEVERIVGEQSRERLSLALNDVVGGACAPL